MQLRGKRGGERASLRHTWPASISAGTGYTQITGTFAGNPAGSVETRATSYLPGDVEARYVKLATAMARGKSRGVLFT